MRTDILSYVLSSGKRKMVVRTIFDYPRRLWSCSDLERLTKISHATVFRSLIGLRHFGILRSMRVNRKDIIYELVYQSPIAKELNKILDVEEGALKGIARSFANKVKSKNVYSIILFGSTVNKTFKPESDIDIMVILKRRNKIAEDEIFDIASEFSYRTNKTISVIIADLPEIMREKDSQFLKSVKSNMQLMYGKDPF